MASSSDLKAYREQVREWMSEHMPRTDPEHPWDPIHGDDDRALRNRELQQLLHSGGFAGICYPKEYGGQGLSIEYQQIFDDESASYDMPMLFSVPTLSIVGPTILEFGTEEQKKRYIPAYIRGDELWVQFLSEPSGGSDIAGALTRADRDGDVFVVNGSKIWSTYAYRSDFGLALVRTNWDVPKHRGLTMLIIPIHHPGVEVQQIRMVDGTVEFCQEFFDDALVPVANVVGEIDDGWTVATRLLFHERAAVGGASPYTSGQYRHGGEETQNVLRGLVHAAGRSEDPIARRRLGRAEVLRVVQRQLIERVRTGLATGYFPGPAGALPRLFAGMAGVERANLAFEIDAERAVVWNESERGGQHGIAYIRRQASCLGGGSTEMARNIISERILRMPREYAADRDTAFSDVRRSRNV